MIKLIAIDLDGTLLTNEKTISERNKTALMKAKEKGVKVVLCTGRPLVSVENYLQELDLLDAEDYSITYNGGLVQANTGEVLGKTAFTLAEVKDVIKLLKSLDLPTDILSGSSSLQIETSKNHPSIYQSINQFVTYFDKKEADLTEEILYNKVLSATEEEVLNNKIAKIPAAYYDRYEIFKSRPILLEFMPKGVTKAFGLSVLGKKLAIDASEMMTLGDEANDLSMIEYAGLGVAMENATEEVKSLANYITGTNQADGVAQAVEKFVLN